MLHWAFDTTVTSTSMSRAGRYPPDEVVPQPVTVASCPVYCGDTEDGRQTGATTREKVMGELRVRMETSYA